MNAALGTTDTFLTVCEIRISSSFPLNLVGEVDPVGPVPILRGELVTARVLELVPTLPLVTVHRLVADPLVVPV